MLWEDFGVCKFHKKKITKITVSDYIQTKVETNQLF